MRRLLWAVSSESTLFAFSILSLLCLPLYFRFLSTRHPWLGNGHIKFHKWKSPLQKLRVKGLNPFMLVDSCTITFWTGLFPVAGCLITFYYNCFIEIPVVNANSVDLIRHHSIWSRSALFASFPFGGLQTKMGSRPKDWNSMDSSMFTLLKFVVVFSSISFLCLFHILDRATFFFFFFLELRFYGPVNPLR